MQGAALQATLLKHRSLLEEVLRETSPDRLSRRDSESSRTQLGSLNSEGDVIAVRTACGAESPGGNSFLCTHEVVTPPLSARHELQENKSAIHTPTASSDGEAPATCSKALAAKFSFDAPPDTNSSDHEDEVGPVPHLNVDQTPQRQDSMDDSGEIFSEVALVVHAESSPRLSSVLCLEQDSAHEVDASDDGNHDGDCQRSASNETDKCSSKQLSHALQAQSESQLQSPAMLMPLQAGDEDMDSNSQALAGGTDKCARAASVSSPRITTTGNITQHKSEETDTPEYATTSGIQDGSPTPMAPDNECRQSSTICNASSPAPPLTPEPQVRAPSCSPSPAPAAEGALVGHDVAPLTATVVKKRNGREVSMPAQPLSTAPGISDGCDVAGSGTRCSVSVMIHDDIGVFPTASSRRAARWH